MNPDPLRQNAAISGFAMPANTDPEPAAEEQLPAGVVGADNREAIEAARERHNAKRGPYNPAAELRKADPLRQREIRNQVLAARSAAANAQAAELARGFAAGEGDWWQGGIEAANNAAEADRVRQRERAQFIAGGWRDQEFPGAVA